MIEINKTFLYIVAVPCDTPVPNLKNRSFMVSEIRELMVEGARRTADIE